MLKMNKEAASARAIKLAQINVESCDTWVDASMVTEFIEEVYAFLRADDLEQE